MKREPGYYWVKFREPDWVIAKYSIDNYHKGYWRLWGDMFYDADFIEIDPHPITRITPTENSDKGAEDEIRKIIYQNSSDDSWGLIIKFENIEKVIGLLAQFANQRKVTVTDDEINQVAHDEASGNDFDSLAVRAEWIDGYEQGAKWMRNKLQP